MHLLSSTVYVRCSLTFDSRYSNEGNYLSHRKAMKSKLILRRCCGVGQSMLRGLLCPDLPLHLFLSERGWTNRSILANWEDVRIQMFAFDPARSHSIGRPECSHILPDLRARLSHLLPRPEKDSIVVSSPKTIDKLELHRVWSLLLEKKTSTS